MQKTANDDIPHPPAPLLPSFTALLAAGDLEGYTGKLCHQGLDWLFHFQLPLLTAHLAPLQHFPSGGKVPPPRIRLLLLAVSPQSNAHLSDLEQLYHTFTAEGDQEAAAACIGLSMQIIIENGRDFSCFEPWPARAEKMMETKFFRPIVKAFLLVFQGWAEIMGPGDITRAHRLLEPVPCLSEQANSPSLVILHAVLVAHISYWRADLAALEILLADVRPFVKSPQISPFAALQYQAALGLLKGLQGKVKEGKKICRNLLSHPMMPYVPLGTWLRIHGNYLYIIASLSDLREIEQIGTAMMDRSVPEYNHYYHSYLHFNLGIVALTQGRPHKSLLHGHESRNLGELCKSRNVARMSALLIGQALMELDRDEDALDHFRQWMPLWKKADYFIIAALGAIEMGYLLLRQGKIDHARRALNEARTMIPKNERIPTLYRPYDYATRLEEILHTALPFLGCHSSEAPVVITTLGKFSVTVRPGKKLYDRNWYGPKAKDLLKAIIALGGSKVSTERLSYLLWPDANGDQAMNAFKVTLSRLRDTLAGKNKSLRRILIVKQKRISLSGSLCFVDAFGFKDLFRQAVTPSLNPVALQAVLDLYGGNFLGSSSDFWIINAREELCEQFVQATLLLCDFFLEQQDIDGTLSPLTKALTFDPLNETVYARLIRSYLLLGNRAKALDIYRKAQLTLERELDIGPGRLLTDLYQQIQKN